MFDKLKNIFSGIGLAVKYGDMIRSFTTAYASFPGLDDSDLLRLWIRPLLTDASALSELTKTQVDDMIAYAAIRVVDNNHAWTAVHSMALLLRDGELAVPSQSVLPHHYNNPLPWVAGVDERNNVERHIEAEGNCGDMFETMRQVAGDIMPECPSAVLTAVGLILFLLQRRSNKN